MLVSSFPDYMFRGGPGALSGIPRGTPSLLLACSASLSVIYRVACGFLQSLFSSLNVFSFIMQSTHRTNNSMSAEVFTSDVATISSESACISLANSSSSSVASAPGVVSPMAFATDPTFMAAVVQGVRLALASENSAMASSSMSTIVSQVSAAGVLHPSPALVAGGVSSLEPTLGDRTAAFFTSGAGFFATQTQSFPSASQGRPALAVPSFVSIFTAPRSSSSFTLSTMGGLPSVPLGDSASSCGSATGHVLHQSFVVGPGFSPIPAKTVAQILAGKFVDFSDLLSVNIVQAKPESHVLLDGRLVFTPSTKKQRRRIKGIVTWTEAFTVFSLILTSYFPHHWRDLTSTNCSSFAPIAS